MASRLEQMQQLAKESKAKIAAEKAEKERQKQEAQEAQEAKENTRETARKELAGATEKHATALEEHKAVEEYIGGLEAEKKAAEAGGEGGGVDDETMERLKTELVASAEELEVLRKEMERLTVELNSLSEVEDVKQEKAEQPAEVADEKNAEVAGKDLGADAKPEEQPAAEAAGNTKESTLEATEKVEWKEITDEDVENAEKDTEWKGKQWEDRDNKTNCFFEGKDENSNKVIPKDASPEELMEYLKNPPKPDAESIKRDIVEQRKLVGEIMDGIKDYLSENEKKEFDAECAKESTPMSRGQKFPKKGEFDLGELNKILRRVNKMDSISDPYNSFGNRTFNEIAQKSKYDAGAKELRNKIAKATMYKERADNQIYAASGVWNDARRRYIEKEINPLLPKFKTKKEEEDSWKLKGQAREKLFEEYNAALYRLHDLEQEHPDPEKQVWNDLMVSDKIDYRVARGIFKETKNDYPGTSTQIHKRLVEESR